MLPLALVLARAALAADSPPASLDSCRLELRPNAAAIEPGATAEFSLYAECAGPRPTGVGVELWQESSAGARVIAQIDDAVLGAAPSLFHVENADVACFVARASRAGESVSTRACLEPVALALPEAPPHTMSRGGTPNAPGLAQCRFVTIAAEPGPRFAAEALLGLSVVIVCPQTVPRVHVSLAREGRPEAAGVLATLSDVALRKGRTRVAFPDAGYRAALGCLRVSAARAGQEIEGRTCVRPTALELVPAAPLRAAAEAAQ